MRTILSGNECIWKWVIYSPLCVLWDQLIEFDVFSELCDSFRMTWTLGIYTNENNSYRYINKADYI